MPRGICNQFAATGHCSYGARCKFTHASSQSGSWTALSAFFEDHSGFVYNPSNPAWDEFNRLAQFEDWDRDEKTDQRAAFKDALVQSFNNIYGTDEDDLESWLGLCQALSITPLPEGLEACRDAVKATYVNLVDLVDLPNTHKPLRLFASEKDLSEYTLNSGKIFPRENANAGNLLEHLLRHIMHPRETGTRTIFRRRNRKRRNAS